MYCSKCKDDRMYDKMILMCNEVVNTHVEIVGMCEEMLVSGEAMAACKTVRS
jgi:hypothetical protein